MICCIKIIMRKILFIIGVFCIFSLSYSIDLFFYGPRSLSLGYGGNAFSYDYNVIINNSSLISNLPVIVGGYNYQTEYFEYNDFSNKLNVFFSSNYANFDSLDISLKSEVVSRINDIYSSKYGIFGSKVNGFGFMMKSYAFAVQFVEITVINPNKNNVMNKKVNDIVKQDLDSLKMDVISFNFKRYILSYSLPVSRNLNIGMNFSYLNGDSYKNEINVSSQSFFDKGLDMREYSQEFWDLCDTGISKIKFDVSISMNVSRSLIVYASMFNIGKPEFGINNTKLVFDNRYKAGLVFRPSLTWGFYFDFDIFKYDYLFNGNKLQNISIGIEKGFFKNMLILRVGMYSDISEKFFFGKNSVNVYSLGLGFNAGKILIDSGVSFNSDGSIRAVAIGGYYIVK